MQRSRVSGVLYNDFDTDPVTGENIGNAGLTAVLVYPPTHGTLDKVVCKQTARSRMYPEVWEKTAMTASRTWPRTAMAISRTMTIVNIHITSDQPDFKIMMNYELGMHCTGFEFSYCCVLPPYNSIVAQVVKPQASGPLTSNADYPRLLTGDPNNGLDPTGPRDGIARLPG